MRRLYLTQVLTTALLVLALFPSATLAKPGSDLSVKTQLYSDGRPTSDARGEVRDFVAWRQCLYVSYATLDGDYYLDVWNIADLGNPVLVNEHHQGNSNDDAHDPEYNIPVGHLQSPRDMRVLDSHLIFWKLFRAHVFALNSDCALGTADGFLFSNGTFPNTMSRLNYGGQLASASAVDENGFTSYFLINLQNPRDAFIHTGPSLPAPLNGAYEGLPAVVSVSQDKRSVDVTTYKQTRSHHMQDFWSTITGSIFQTVNSETTLRSLLADILSDQYLTEQQGRIIDIFRNGASTQTVDIRKKKKKRKAKKKKKKRKKKGKKKGKKKKKKRKPKPGEGGGDDDGENGSETPADPDTTLVQLVSRTYEDGMALGTLLDELSIKDTDTVRVALQKAIEAHLSSALNETLRQNIMPDLMEKWRGKFMAIPDTPLSEVRVNLKALLDSKLDTTKLQEYTLHNVLGPLVGNPAFFQYSLDDILDGITNNDVASAIDDGLGVYHAWDPDPLDLIGIGWDPPVCFQIPQSSRAMLDILLVDAGAKLNPDGWAFFELLKLVEFYLGRTDMRQFEDNLDESLRNYHDAIGGEVINQSLAFLNQADQVQSTLKEFYNSFGTEYSLTPVLAELLSQVIIDELSAGAAVSAQTLDPTLTIEEYLASHGLIVDASKLEEGESLATVADLLRHMRNQNLQQITVKKLRKRAKEVNLDILRNALNLPLERLVDELFGAGSLDITLAQAIERWILGRTDPRITGDFVKGTLDSILTRTADGALRGVLGSKALALQGDCISQWIEAINAGIIASESSVIFAGVGAALIAINTAIDEAYNAALRYVITSLVAEFLKEIITDSGSSYESWYTAMSSQGVKVVLDDLSAPVRRLVDADIFENKLAVLLRDVGSLGAINEDEWPVELYVLDPYNAAATKLKVELGNWQSVTGVQFSEGHLLMSGRKIFSNGDTALAAVLVNYTEKVPTVRLLHGDDGLLFTATPQLRVARNGETFIAQSQLGGLVLFEQK